MTEINPTTYTKSAHGLGMWSAFRPKDDKGELRTAQELAAEMREIGVTWWAPRVGDHAKLSDFTEASFAQTCEVFGAAGILVLPWYYSRPQFYKNEPPLAKRLLALGAAGIIIDAEAEWKQKFYADTFNAARDYGVRMRDAVGDAYVAHAPLAWLAYHGDFPFREFGTFCDQVHPQSYWTELKYGKYDAEFKVNCLETWERAQAAGDVRAKNFAPIGVTYGRRELISRGMPAKTAPPGMFDRAHLRDFLERYEKHEESLGGVRRTVSLYTYEVAAPGAFEEVAARLERIRGAVTRPEHTQSEDPSS